MKLAKQAVALFLAAEGRDLLMQARALSSEDERPVFTVEESEDLGLWLRKPREDGMHLFLLQWHYILGIDIGVESGESLGLGAQFR
jgi:hypothetical protein